jgi:hypothetical protein
MFEVSTLHTAPQSFPRRVFAVIRPMRDSGRQDTPSSTFPSVAIWHVLSITPRFIWPEFSQEHLKWRNSAGTALKSFSKGCIWRLRGAGVKARQGTWL